MRFRVQQQQRAQQRALRTQQRREARQADRDSRYADDQVARGARGGPQGQAGRREGAPEKAPQAAATEEPPPAFSLRRSELAYKTVVSRSSGTCYGVCRTLWVDTDTWQHEFLIVTLVSVVFININAAIFQGGILGVAGKFPPAYMGAVFSGQAVGGIFASGCNVVFLALGASASQSGFFCFLTSVLFLLTALVAYGVATRYR